MASISVCVPVYQGHGAPNISTLAASMPAALGGLQGELVVALNGVAPDRGGLPEDAVIVDLGINRGVAPGWNAAAQKAKGDVLVFANDDVIFGPDALAQLAKALHERPDAGAVGPLGARWSLAEQRHIAWVDLAGHPAGETEQCDVVSGFMIAARRDVYERAGGFDERYAPCTSEELDFCTTVQVRLGLHCYVVAGVNYQHEFHISSARPWRRLRHNGRTEMLWRIHRRNRRYYRRKWAGVV